MIWIALAIILSGLLIFYALNNVKKVSEVISKDELERLPVFRYNFEIEKIVIEPRNFKEKHEADIYLTEDRLKKFKELKGLPISIILETHPEFMNDGTFTAKCRAEEKAGELVAALMGISYGGFQRHLKNFDESADISKQVAVCKLVSVEQILPSMTS